MVTIKDVARHAGVSASTASRALHDNPMISAATKARVRQAMKDLNYSPNFSAQNLVKRQSNTVAIVLPVRESPQLLGNNPFFMQIIQGITSICSQEGFMVSLATGQSEQALLDSVRVLMQSGHVDKFIFLYARKGDAIYQAVRENPAVTCIVVGHNSTQSHQNTYFVDTDNVRAGYDATRFLMKKHYKTPVYICTDLGEVVQESRYEGYTAAMAVIEEQPHSVELTNTDSDKVRLEGLLKASPQTDAFVCCDDMTAIYVLRLLKEQVRNQSFGIISFNNSLLAELESPSLTSVDIFPYELGEAAAKLMLAVSAGQKVEKECIIAHQIIERQSTQL